MDLRTKPCWDSRCGLGRMVNGTGRAGSTAARTTGWKIGSDVTRPENSGKDPACCGPGGGPHCVVSGEAERYGSAGGGPVARVRREGV
jgi:hypothetical protein